MSAASYKTQSAKTRGSYNTSIQCDSSWAQARVSGLTGATVEAEPGGQAWRNDETPCGGPELGGNTSLSIQGQLERDGGR